MMRVLKYEIDIFWSEVTGNYVAVFNVPPPLSESPYTDYVGLHPTSGAGLRGGLGFLKSTGLEHVFRVACNLRILEGTGDVTA